MLCGEQSLPSMEILTENTREQFVINRGYSLTVSVWELMLMDVSVSSFSTASTSPFSATSCILVFPCRILLQVMLSISSRACRPSLFPDTRVMHKKVFVERESLYIDIDRAHIDIYSCAQTLLVPVGSS